MSDHGTLTRARYCGCALCVAEQTRYVKRWRRARDLGHDFRVPAGPSQRKIQALHAMGWPIAQIAHRMGRSHQSLTNTLSRDMIKPSTEAAIEEVYRELEMKIPEPSRAVTQARNRARARGWPPPLAWEDIDAGILAKPEPIPRARLDYDLVEYVMQYHDFAAPMSPREKSEVVRRWVANGRTEHELCQLTGWRQGRYREAS